MFLAAFHPEKNLLSITYTGLVTPEEAEGCAGEVAALSANLLPGFRLLVDLGKLERMDLGCLPHVKQVMDLCNKLGVGTVIRVIPDPRKDPGLNILSIFHYDPKVQVLTRDSLPAALAVLSGLTSETQ